MGGDAKKWYLGASTATQSELVKWNHLTRPFWHQVAWKDASIAAGNLFSKLDPNAQSDIQVAKKNLILISADSTQHESSDWTREEEEEIQKSIKEFLDSTEGMVDQIYCFPTRMGRRKRKLIHFVAEKFNLAHWSRGKKDCEKTVAIARRGRRKRKGVTESD